MTNSPSLLPSPESLPERYRRLAETPSDINEHLPWLYEIACKGEYLVEIGVRYGVSLTALVASGAASVIGIDQNLVRGHKPLAELLHLAGLTSKTTLTLIQADSLKLKDIWPIDFLHIDSDHHYAQLLAELRIYGPNVRDHIAIHDTTLFKGELVPAIDKWIEEQAGAWEIAERRENCNGMTLLRRVDDGPLSRNRPLAQT